MYTGSTAVYRRLLALCGCTQRPPGHARAAVECHHAVQVRVDTYIYCVSIMYACIVTELLYTYLHV